MKERGIGIGRRGGVGAGAAALLACLGGAPGCAIHYFDPETHTEHVWGFGHLKMKLAAPSEGVRAAVSGVDTFGLGLGAADGQGYAVLGWQRLQYLRVIQESTAVRLEWPTADFVNVRVGSDFPAWLRTPPYLDPAPPAPQAGDAEPTIQPTQEKPR